MNYESENRSQLSSLFEDGISWNLRGLGVGGGISLVTGQLLPLGLDMSGFVKSREAGLLLVQLFNGRAYLDYRPSEPNWIQVKVCVEEKFKPLLQLLLNGVNANNSTITSYLLSECYQKFAS